MPYNPKIHHRKSIRLKGYDYSQAGFYFITICVQDREYLFGNNENGEMILNDAGRMVEKWYYELENKFPDKKCHEMMVMPNHFHCIIENVVPVGADLRVCPNNTINPSSDASSSDASSSDASSSDESSSDESSSDESSSGESSMGKSLMGESLMGKSLMGKSLMGKSLMGKSLMGKSLMGEHVGSPLHRAVQWFKTMTTNEYIRGVKQLEWLPFNRKLWQRNYWEHIIRDEQSHQRIAKYIINNPRNWANDKFNNQ